MPLLLASVGAVAAPAKPGRQQLSIDLRIAENVPAGTKISVKLRAKYAHLRDPKVVPRDGSRVVVGEENEVFVLWAKETADLEVSVPAKGRAADETVVLTFNGPFPDFPAGHFDGIFIPVECAIEYPKPVGGKSREARSATFGMPKPEDPGGWSACLRFELAKGRAQGMKVSLLPKCEEARTGGLRVPGR